ncbi:MAG: LacI family transcriptional regulator [Actinobacteria bacterium]|nr:LacI family transcriptional regulator [Actinomycetota bacterium]
MGDVAARAGVSLKSVSRVVNAEQHVSADLAERVRRAITELGYRPDRRARDLAAAPASGRLIGYVQVDAANLFFAAVYRGLEDTTRTRGSLIIAGSTDADPERETALIETLIESRVDGLVIAAAEGSDELLRREIAHGTPVVCVDRLLANAPCDTVVSSNRDSTRAAVVHLRELGHARIAFLGGDQRVWTATERLAGYREALHNTAGELDPDLEIVDVGDVARATQATRRLLTAQRAPTAIFTAQDRITTGTITALHELGRQYDVALFGFDEIPFSEQLNPSVSVVAQDPYEMGRRAGQLLLNRLSDRSSTTPVQTVVEATLRHRQSGQIVPLAPQPRTEGDDRC